MDKQKLEDQIEAITAEITFQKSELEQHRDDILQKNQILEQQKEEILAQSEDILEKNQILEQQKEEIEVQKEELEKQRDILEVQNTNIKDSINYASKIQHALLPPGDTIREVIPENFVLYRPKDIIGGDFYWVKKIKNIIVVAVADCTGHGVPGALMSMLGISLLTEVYNRTWLYSPGNSLDMLRRKIKQALRQSNEIPNQRDGMDISLYSINTETLEMEFAGAFNSIFILRKKEPFEPSDKLNIVESDSGLLIEIRADRQPVGIHFNEKEFTTTRFQLKQNDVIYSFTDGFFDQLGGMDFKKFRAEKFKKLLLEIHTKPLFEQKEILEQTLDDWKKFQDQIDDILVLGVRITPDNFS